jgi:4-hydroxybenzoate polyprenyltransferase
MHPLLQLMRLDKPIGIWLLAFPALWAVGLAAQDTTQLFTLSATMLVGAAITRAAGCIINDLTDQRLDAHVERTRNRPLAAGRVTRQGAFILLFLLLTLALLIALSLPRAVLYLALLAVPMIAAYPWMKRITWWPQVFLGLTFNLSALMGWATTGHALDATSFMLYGAATAWTLGYDTIYAIQDIADDEKLGIRSTARRVGNRVITFVTLCYLAVFILLLILGIAVDSHWPYFIGLVLAATHALWQIRQLPCPPEHAGAIFRSNQWLGLAILLGILAARVIG